MTRSEFHQFTPRMGEPGPLFLVTGANGFLGSHLVPMLAATGKVRALVRRPALVPASQEQVVLAADFRGSQLEALFNGVDTVIHLAGRAHVSDKDPRQALARHREVNRDLTGDFAAAAGRAGVRRFVFLSSVAVMGGEQDRVLTEGVLEAPTTPYGISKLEGEHVLRNVVEESGMEYVILRPPMVYGPRMKGHPNQLFKAIFSGIPMPVAGARNRRSILYVGNLAEAVRIATMHREASNGVFFLSDGPPVSTADLVRMIAQSFGRSPRLVKVPQWLLRLALSVSGAVPGIGLPGSDVLKRLFGSFEIDMSRFQSATGFRPPYTTRQGIERTAAWWRSSQKVPRAK